MNVNNLLTRFAQSELVLSHNDTEREKIKSSIKQLENVLSRSIGKEISKTILFGSYTRNTILPRKYDPNSDIDLMVLFNTQNCTKSPGTYRRYLYNAISSAYPNSISRKSAPAVKLELNHIMFDIVPAYYEDFFGSAYYIPRSDTSWQNTWPNDINRELEQKNKSYGNNVIRNVIRLCKHWNASQGYPYESYHMEKGIVNQFYFSTKNTLDLFLTTMDRIGGQRPGVRQALDRIQTYRGNWITQPNEAKQLEWLKKLLPGFNLRAQF